MDWLWVLIVAIRAVSPSADDQWASRLTELDRSRAAAFAAAEPSRLAEVYVPGSAAARNDAAAIDAYARRDGRVVGAELRVLACAVVEASDDEVRLDVVDLLSRARVEWGDGTSTDLPRDEPSRRSVTMVRTDSGWRIAETHLVARAR